MSADLGPLPDAMSFPPLPPSPAEVGDLTLQTREHVQSLGWGNREQLYTASQVRAVMSECAAMAAARERTRAYDLGRAALAEALQVRHILEEIKKVAAIYPASDMPTPFQSAWQQCCEEIFFRATGEQWHMDEDADRFQTAREALKEKPE